MGNALRLVLGLITLQACGRPGAGDPDPVADQLLAGAGRAMGEVGRVKSLTATANVNGPSGSFRSTVYSARDGRARLSLGRFLAGIGTAKGWVYDQKAATLGPLDDTTRSVIRGHELHMLVLAPVSRWRQPRSHGSEQWAGEATLKVGFRDNLGAPATLYLGARDTLPIGLRLVNHTGKGPPDVLVTFAQWEKVEGVRLFRHAVFTHGSARYVYDYTELRLNAVPDSTFEPPGQPSAKPSS